MASAKKMERVLVAKRTLSNKVAIIFKEQSPMIRGTVCIVLIKNVVDNYNILPRLADSNGLIIVKLKKKCSTKVMLYLSLSYHTT